MAQQLRRRKSWKSIHKKLLDLQFYKGLAIATGTVEELKKIVRPINDRPVAVPPPLKIDLRKGISEAEHRLDETRPAHVELYYGNQLIGSLVQIYGFEPYKGAHLRAILAKEFQWDILKSLAFDNPAPSGATDTKSFFALTEKEISYGYSGSSN
jgi:hypothetical protein